MTTKLSQLFRSPDALVVVIVLTLVALISIAGMTAPAPDHRSDLDNFMVDHKKRYSQHDEELVIRHFFQDEREGFFLDIGCAWPIKNSTTFYLARHLDWTGVAVDALDHYAEGWARNRPETQFFNYAISDQSGGKLTFYRAGGSGVSSLFEDHAAERSKKDLVPIEVDTITLNDLLEQVGIEAIDFLSMDIEGAEMLALAGFDIDRYQPRFVCIEGRWSSENAAKILDYFDSHDYVLMEEYNRYEKANYYFRSPEPRVSK